MPLDQVMSVSDQEKNKSRNKKYLKKGRNKNKKVNFDGKLIEQ